MPGTPTTKYAIPTFNAGGTDPVNTGHTQVNSALSTIDGAMAGYATGTFAGKPAAGKAGRLYLCTDTGQWLADTGSTWVELGQAPPLVTSLPGSPYDGQEVYFSADATNGVVWHLRYRSASASAYKWEYVGGSPLIAAIDSTSSITRNDTTWVDLGLSFTLALAGEYEIALSAQLQLNSGAGGWLGLIIAGSADGATGMAWSASMSATGSLFVPLSSPTMRKIVTPAASVVKARGRGINANTTLFADRSLVIRPLRVG